MGPVVAGEVIAVLLRAHGTDTPDPYLDQRIQQEVLASGGLASLGPRRSLQEHLETASSRWDPARAPVFGGRHVILGLAMDAGVGWTLLQDGVIGSLLSRWRPGLGTPEEPHRLVWDVLSQTGRDLAEEQPLLAAAFGAPAEWTAPMKAPATAMAWSPGGDRIAVLAGGTVYEARPGGEPRHAIGRLREAEPRRPVGL